MFRHDLRTKCQMCGDTITQVACVLECGCWRRARSKASTSETNWGLKMVLNFVSDEQRHMD